MYAGALDYQPDTDCSQLAIALHELAGTATAQQAAARQRLLLQLAPGSALQPNATPESPPDCARLLERYDIPADADVQFEQGAILAASGDIPGARRLWGQVVQQAPGTDAATLAARALNEAPAQ